VGVRPSSLGVQCNRKQVRHPASDEVSHGQGVVLQRRHGGEEVVRVEPAGWQLKRQSMTYDKERHINALVVSPYFDRKW
jgi:hypothetical protein